MNEIQIGFGALKSPEDARDWTLASVGSSVKDSTAYTQQCFIDIDWMISSMQGQIGCCVACSFEEIMRLIVYISTGVKSNPDTEEELSWRFVYAVAKSIEGTVQDTGDYRAFSRTFDANDGTYPALVAQVIRKYGIPLAKYCPNDVSTTADEFCYGRNLKDIPQKAFADALTRKAGADITEPVSVAGIKAAINYAKENNGGVAILRRLGNEYWTNSKGVSSWKRDELLPMSAPTSVQSGHEEFLYGYLDVTPKDRKDLNEHKITIESLIAKYPDGYSDTTRTETLVFWLNHWSQAWCSTSGNRNGTDAKSKDGGRGWEFLDIWLPYIVELRISLPEIPQVKDGFTYKFTKTLKLGDKGADVVALQHVLDLEGCYDYNPTDSSKRYTGNYLGLTKSGVKKLQEKYASDILKPVGLNVGTGNFGTSTMAWVNKKYSPL